MNRAEAAGVLAILLAAFPREVIEEETAELWYAELADLESSGTANVVARGIARGEDRFPTLHHFRESYHERVRRQREALAESSGLPEGRRAKKPEWVDVWYFARRLRQPSEERMFPQHADPQTPANLVLSSAEYDALREEWVQAGSPTGGVTLFAMLPSA